MYLKLQSRKSLAKVCCTDLSVGRSRRKAGLEFGPLHPAETGGEERGGRIPCLRPGTGGPVLSLEEIPRKSKQEKAKPRSSVKTRR